MGDSFIEMANLIDSVNLMVYYFIGFIVILFSWFALLGVPFTAFLRVLKAGKEASREEDEEIFIYIKSAFIALIIAFIVSVIYFGMFVGVLQVGTTAGEVVSKVLLLN